MKVQRKCYALAAITDGNILFWSTGVPNPTYFKGMKNLVWKIWKLKNSLKTAFSGTKLSYLKKVCFLKIQT